MVSRRIFTESMGKKKESEITVDVEREIGKVSRYMFGQNLEPATCGKLVWPAESSGLLR